VSLFQEGFFPQYAELFELEGGVALVTLLVFFNVSFLSVTLEAGTNAVMSAFFSSYEDSLVH
jgi:hypothetical protein